MHGTMSLKKKKLFLVCTKEYEVFISFSWIYVFSFTKNRRGIAGSGNAVSRIVGFPTFTGAYWWETPGSSVSKIVPVNTLTTKIPSVLYSLL